MHENADMNSQIPNHEVTSHQIDDIPRRYRKAMGIQAVAKKLLKKKSKTTGLKDSDSNQGPSDAQKERYQAALSASEDEAQNLAMHYGKATCLPICQKMQQKLPRELRDITYDYLLDVPSNTMTERVWLVKRPTDCKGCYFQATPRSDCKLHGMSHLRNPEYLGQETVEELAEVWYCSSEFELSGEYTLETLVRENPWGVLFPLNGFINKVYVRASKYDMLERGEAPETGWKVPTGPSLRLRDIFLPLFGIRAGAKITVRLIIFEKDWLVAQKDPQTLIDTVTPAFDFCKQLTENGFHVVIRQRWGVSDDDSNAITTAKDWVESNKFRPRPLIRRPSK